MINCEPRRANDMLDALALSQRFLLWNVRAWACCCRGRRLPAEPVQQALTNIGIPDGATSLDIAMTHLVLATCRPLAVNCPPYAFLSDDEAMLIAAAGAAQRRDLGDSRALLGRVLSDPALDLVVEALLDLGLLFATVGVVLPQGPGHSDGDRGREPLAVVATPTLH